MALENGPSRAGADAFNVLAAMASEEPGIVRVMITQNGERGALIGGEGLIVDRPQTRRGLLGD